ncbi:LysE family translocator [Mesorhizobium sp. YC-39]|uniref:LysE family translocator n=1 Tax=unclassified Mesorhizobium TaxID=325217 RepID=UPI0021E7C527|nr:MULTISPECIES: LysE family translocator [unclassified Mesorhizobium]MCV3207648.1 LysE family translocator [Mesorhizobium sp. YC-2]MCV3229375.1 LysE family translocator [Mesorhizobium sp. YC-39]
MAEQILSHAELWQRLLTLVLASTVVMGSPGPATISVAAVGAAFGLRYSLCYASGVIAGTIAVLLVVTTGVMVMLASVPNLTPLLAAASAAYILYLAFKIATAPPVAARTDGAALPTFLGGLLLAVANPKAYVAIAAVFAATPSYDLDTRLKLVVLAVMIVAIHVLWLLAGAAFARFLRRPRASRIINLIFAAILVLTTALAALA